MLYRIFIFLCGQNQSENPDWSSSTGSETQQVLCHRKNWTIVERTVETCWEKGQSPKMPEFPLRVKELKSSVTQDAVCVFLCEETADSQLKGQYKLGKRTPSRGQIAELVTCI